MLITVLSLFLMGNPPAVKNEMRFGHPGQSRLQPTKRLLRPDGHLFAADEKEPFLQFALKPRL